MTVSDLKSLQQRLQRRIIHSQPHSSDSRGQSPSSDRPSTSGASQRSSTEIDLWLMKAEAMLKEKQTAESFFDITIVNDDIDEAYKHLRDFALNAYWKENKE